MGKKLKALLERHDPNKTKRRLRHLIIVQHNLDNLLSLQKKFPEQAHFLDDKVNQLKGEEERLIQKIRKQ